MTDSDASYLGFKSSQAFKGFTGSMAAVQKGDFQRALDLLSLQVDVQPSSYDWEAAKKFLDRVYPNREHKL